MRYSISNIAWDVCQDREVVALLRDFSIDAIDIAPGKYFRDPSNVSAGEVREIRARWNDQGIEIVGMQSLLFGRNELNLFGDRENQTRMLSYLATICELGAGLGASNLVFGSPRNRDRTGLNDLQAHDIAVSFFKRLGDIAGASGVNVCLEPNPECYNSNFMTTCDQTSNIVRAVAHDAIRMQLDTGALTLNGEDIEDFLSADQTLIGHIHLSTPYLRPLSDGQTELARQLQSIRRILPGRVVTIEMLTPNEQSSLTCIADSLSFLRDLPSQH